MIMACCGSPSPCLATPSRWLCLLLILLLTTGLYLTHHHVWSSSTIPLLVLPTSEHQAPLPTQNLAHELWTSDEYVDDDSVARYEESSVDSQWDEYLEPIASLLDQDQPLSTWHVASSDQHQSLTSNQHSIPDNQSKPSFQAENIAPNSSSSTRSTSHQDIESNTEYASPEEVPKVKVLGARCDQIIQGDERAMKLAESHLKVYPITPIPDNIYPIFTSDCERFRRDRQYLVKPVSAEEADFSIAFSIVMFKDVEQFERLLRAIYRPQNVYCVHIDAKAEHIVHQSVIAIVKCFDNVLIASRLTSVEWGQFSLLQPELTCMEDLWKYKKWQYFINLTGQEFPLKTNLDIVRILKAFKGANNMEGTVKRRNKDRTKYLHVSGQQTTQLLPPPPVNVTLTKGSVHISATRRFVDYVLHDPRALKFRDWVKDTGVPDETFFSSLNHSPQLDVPGAYTGEPETDNIVYPFFTRFKNWGDGPFNWPCMGQRVRMICIFSLRDIPMLSKRPEIFANKFYAEYEPLALSCLEELHYNRTRAEILGTRDFDVTPYTKYDFVTNHV